VPLDQGLIDWVTECMEQVGTVTFRSMMGGATFYCDGTVFAIIAMDALWFKADKVSDVVWDAQGCERFTFEMKGRIATMNYRRAPDDVHDDSDALRHWAGLGLEAGRRAPTKKVKARLT
jgi:DNA transformation protein and related proteins